MVVLKSAKAKVHLMLQPVLTFKYDTVKCNLMSLNPGDHKVFRVKIWPLGPVF